MHTFVELREKLKLKGGEKQVASQKSKRGSHELVITKKGNKFNLYLDDELAQKDIKSEKEARKTMQDMLKMLR